MYTHPTDEVDEAFSVVEGAHATELDLLQRIVTAAESLPHKQLIRWRHM